MSRDLDARATPPVEVAPQFPALDTMRAVGAVAVLTTHTSFQTGAYVGHGVFGALLARLDVGVAIFFVLSGFLLSRSFVARAALHLPQQSTATYYEKRALRILPVYLVTVVTALLVVPGNDSLGLWDWLVSFTMVDALLHKSLPHGLTQMWSLAVEVGFYLLLPALMRLLLGRHLSPGRMGAGLGLLVLVNLLWLVAVPRLDSHVAGAPGLWLPSYLSWFAVGIALATVHVLYQQGHASRLVTTLASLGERPGVCWSAAAGLMLMAATPLAGPVMLEVPTVGQAMTRNVLYAAIGALLVLTGVFTGPGFFTRIFSHRALRHLGLISYSIFCIHLVVLSLVFEATDIAVFTGHGLQVWALTLIGSIVAAEILYRLVEVPGLRLKARLRREESRANVPHEAASTATTR